MERLPLLSIYTGALKWKGCPSYLSIYLGVLIVRLWSWGNFCISNSLWNENVDTHLFCCRVRLFLSYHHTATHVSGVISPLCQICFPFFALFHECPQLCYPSVVRLPCMLRTTCFGQLVVVAVFLGDEAGYVILLGGDMFAWAVAGISIRVQ